MTFSDIQNEVTDRLNLSSAQAIARVGRSINERYKWVSSSIGIQTINRGVATARTTIGDRSLVFAGVEKLYTVYNTAFTPPIVLDEMTFDELRNLPVGTDPPMFYAIQLMGASSVTVFLSSSPATAYVLNADAELNLSTLSGSMTPNFAEDFHNILTYWAMAVELDKMEKPELAKEKKELSDRRLSDLRFFIAKSAYLEAYQGKDKSSGVTNPRV